jgi:thioredoxin reductase
MTVLLIVCGVHSAYADSTTYDGQFLVVGAGPAGIATVGVLLQVGVKSDDIIWLDNKFDAGRLGEFYETVPGNTKNKLFVDFIESCDAFKDFHSEAIDALKACDHDKEYELTYIVQALRAITQHLATKVHCINGRLHSLYSQNGLWHVDTGFRKLKTKSVVLATGSHPKSFHYDEKKEIPLDIALDRYKLKNLVKPDDTVLVMGSAHSAILLLKFLSDIHVNKVINLYKSPIQYAVDMGDWILHNSTGLKGTTAQWAKDVLEKKPPQNLIRLYNNPQNLEASLKEATKIIYAVGYEKNELPSIKENPSYAYDDTTGVIASGLFGIGIAFPEKYEDPLGNVEHRVGLSSFMEYAQKVVPQWVVDTDSSHKDLRLRQKLKCLKKYDQLFDISVL